MVKSKERWVEGSDGKISIVDGNGRDRASWDEFALALAQAATTRSEDPYVQVGACALRHDHTVASIGYNGAPSDVEIDWSDREKRSAQVIHAETNCLNYVKPGEAYMIAVTRSPCCECLKDIAAKRIKYVVYRDDHKDINESSKLADDYGITMVKIAI